MRKRRFFSTLLLCTALIVGLVVYMASLDKQSGDSPASVSVRINEVMTSNKGSVPDELGNFPDWVELYNPSDKTVDLSGYGLSDSLIEGGKYVFPSGTRLEPGEYIVIYCSGEAETPLHAAFRLSARDELAFFNSAGKALSSISLKAVAAGMTLALDESGAWQEMKPSPGYPNTEEGAAAFEAGLHETEDIGVYINEFLASNATSFRAADGSYCDWIELYNSTDAQVDLSGFGISDNLTQPMKYQLPQGTSIPAGGYLLILCSGNEGLIEGELHAPFSLRAYKEDVVLSSPNGKILDSFSYQKQETDISMARMPDGSGAFAPCAQPSPGYPNTGAGYTAALSANKLPLGDVYISEMLGSNQSGKKAADGNYYDWVEVHNASSAAVNLKGYGLSNNPKNPAKWVFPEVTLEPDEYLVVYASGLNQADGQKKNDLHLNFSVSAAGENLFLFDPNGTLVDKLSAGLFQPDVSYGRNPTDERAYYTEPTPGAANGSGYAGITAQPRFITTPGIYEGSVAIELTAGEGETIHYTTDCTTPTANSPAYSGPIQATKNTVIRAIALRDGYLTGFSASGTFLLKGDGVNHSLPVVTLVTDPDNLWNSKTGIYATGENFDPDATPFGKVLESALYYKSKFLSEEQRDANWERAASLGLFDESGKEVFSQNVDIRISGSFGRGRAQKGFNITARAEYGKSRMQYKFFANRDFAEYKSITLRAGAQDQNRSKIRDELATGLLEGMNIRVLNQAYKPYVLYLNGEYWGVYFLKEKRSRFFVAQHAGVEDTENIDLLKGDATNDSMISHGSRAEWQALMDYVKSNDLSQAQAYEYVASQMDVDSFMDYMICEIYTGNTDTYNAQYYKLPGGKWTWIFYDFCWGFNTGKIDHDTLAYRREGNTAARTLFNAMLNNTGWKDAFVRRFAELLNTAFTPERVTSLIDELAASVEPEITRERDKFNQSTFMGEKQPAENLGTYEKFQSEVAFLREFAQKRPAAIKKQLQSGFGLSDSYMQEVFGA